MRKLSMFILFAAFVGLAACSEETELTKPVEVKSATPPRIFVNNSTIYRTEPNAVWTTSLNQLPTLTRFTVTPTTFITLNGQRATLSQLKPGYIVCIFYTNNLACATPLPCYTAVRIVATIR